MTSKPIASALLSELLNHLGVEAWRSFSDTDRRLVEACCNDAADIQLALVAGGGAPTSAGSLAAEKAHIAAQLACLSAATGASVEKAIWEVASRLLTRAAAAVLA
ncbi:hypothetical protein [Humisphaera borealis]|uniref:Uncharacterized protein n=1 Tax=Humisphaera borealis TaxID=2807512 RepID=A0A7M2X213_9BACT|nr:hypothetical protein [Humisphaera borealis]QOV91639.1 hypothetical protein IPV69_09855 [Humisphaera borealis]